MINVNVIDIAVVAYLKLRHPERQHHGAIHVVAGRGAHGGAGGVGCREECSFYLVISTFFGLFHAMYFEFSVGLQS